MQFKNEDLLLAYYKKESPNHHKVLLQSWNWTAETFRDLFSSDIMESFTISLAYAQLQIDNERAYLVYHYELDSEEKSTKLFKFNLTSKKLENWDLEGEKLKPSYFR